MSPDSSEGRERIVRLEGALEDVERQVERNERMFGPLPLAVERLQWTIDAINARLDKRDQELDARYEKSMRSLENQITACSSQVAQVAEAQRVWQEAEQKRREAEREQREAREREAADAAEASKTQRFVAKYGLISVWGAAIFAAVTSLVIAFFGGQ